MKLLCTWQVYLSCDTNGAQGVFYLHRLNSQPAASARECKRTSPQGHPGKWPLCLGTIRQRQGRSGLHTEQVQPGSARQETRSAKPRTTTQLVSWPGQPRPGPGFPAECCRAVSSSFVLPSSSSPRLIFYKSLNFGRCQTPGCCTQGL